MPRRGLIARRELQADPLYNSALVTKFINSMMFGGKRSTSQQIMYEALGVVQQKTQDDPLKIFKKAVDNVRPLLEKGLSAMILISSPLSHLVRLQWVGVQLPIQQEVVDFPPTP